MRITPAYAGKSMNVLRPFCNINGSPPRMRGKVPETYRYVAGYGITPAYAGKSPDDKEITGQV